MGTIIEPPLTTLSRNQHSLKGGRRRRDTKNPTLRGEKLLDAVHKYYTSRKNKKWNKVPMAFQHQGGDDKERAMRNLRRYIQKAEKVVLNAARGQFPGDY